MKPNAKKINAMLAEKIAKFGWTIIAVGSDGVNPGYSYTVGLFEKFNHPEMIVFGLPQEVAHHIIHDVANEHAKKDKMIATDCIYNQLMQGFDTAFLKVDLDQMENYLYALQTHYGKACTSVPSIQLIWTDTDNHFPWDKAFNEDFRPAQPLLGTPHPVLLESPKPISIRQLH